jgi:outer membrane protein assembly factor BamB
MMAVLLCGVAAMGQRTAPTAIETAQKTVVTVRWGARPGVSRYRLQLANDRDFADIVFDRVVYGHEYQVSDLLPGKYFWRVASLDGKLGEFSSAGVIDVTQHTETTTPLIATPARDAKPSANASSVATRNGWYAAFADISKPTLAHLRSASGVEIVATTNDNRVIAIDGLTGVALWIRQLNLKTGTAPLALAIRDRSGLDDVFVLSGTTGFLFDGKTGREVWHGSLPGVVATAVASDDKAFVIDNSLQRAFLVNASTAKLIADVRLPARVVGAPVFTNAFGALSVVVALEDGRLQVFDESGKLTHTGDAASAVTTGPLFVRTSRGQLLLVGTRNGLTALNAEDLRPLGRVTLKDSPRGSLFAQDLDNDGTPEVVLFTDSDRVVAVKSDEGKVVWEADAKRSEAASFADINGDHVLDLLMTGREGAAFALSGRDGATIWREESSGQIVTNHAPAMPQRSSLVVSSPTGVLFIATDPIRGGLRALEFPQAVAPRN